MRRGMSSLSADQLQTLQTFQEISQITDETLSLQILQANRWNLEASLSQFMGHEDRSVDGEGDVDENPYGHGYGATLENAREGTSSHSVTATNQNGNQIDTANNGGGSILDLLFIPLRWLFQSRPISVNPSRDAQKFVAEFSASYGLNGPRFHDNSYQSAVSTAFQESKFLLVYLHSPLHEDTDRFCNQGLCAPQFVNMCSQNVVFWGGKVYDPEAYGLSSQLSVSAFPFLALLICQSSRTAQIADRIQGFQDTASLITRLENAMAQYSTIMQRNRIELERRREAQRLREEQDREYRESMELERREQERREREERERIEAEEKKKQEEELAAAVELSKKLSREDAIRKLKVAFNSIPEPDKVPDAATIRFQLPRGLKLERRFLKSEPVQRIKQFLTIHFADEGDITKNFALCTNYPKMEITDFDKTVQEMNLFPRAMLYVTDLDA